jgi:hypothetical protein
MRFCRPHTHAPMPVLCLELKLVGISKANRVKQTTIAEPMDVEKQTTIAEPMDVEKQTTIAEPTGVEIQTTIAEPTGVEIQTTIAEPTGVEIQTTIAEAKWWKGDEVVGVCQVRKIIRGSARRRRRSS